MKLSKISFLLIIIAVVTSCSNLPKYQKAADGKLGYIDENVTKGEHKVAAILKKETSDLNVYMYLLLRVGQLCKNEGKNFYRIEQPQMVEALNENNNKYSTTGYCDEKGSEVSFGPKDFKQLENKFYISDYYKKSLPMRNQTF